MTSPTITAVNISRSVVYGASNKQIISVPCIEIKLSDGAVFKGDAHLNLARSLNGAELDSIESALNHTLMGESSADFLTLCKQLEQAEFQVEEWHYPEPEPESAEKSLKKNRREMLSILGVVEPEQPKQVLTLVEYPLPAQIMRGTTAALLRASAHARQQTLLEAISEILGQSSESVPQPSLGLDVSLASKQALLGYASALTYTIPAASGADSLGKSVEKFQKYLRELNSWINESWAHKEPDDRPALFIDLNGAVHRLNGNISGKTLGSLFGFSTTGNQEKMIFANTIINDSLLKTANDTTLLQSLVKSRKLKLKLAAASFTNSIENVTLWLEKCKPELIVLKEHETANLSTYLTIIKRIESSQAELILIGGQAGNSRSWEIIHTIAQAAGPMLYIPAGGEQGFVDVINR